MDFPRFRYIKLVDCAAWYCTAIESVLMENAEPALMLMAISEPSMMIGYNCKTHNLDRKKMKADGIRGVRQAPRGLFCLLSDENELTISISVGSQYYDCKAKALLAFFNEIINDALWRVGVAAVEAQKNARSESRAMCFGLVSRGDILTRGVKIATSAFRITSAGYVQGSVLDVTGKSDTAKYLKDRRERLGHLSVNGVLQTQLSVRRDVIPAFEAAFADVVGLDSRPLDMAEQMRASHYAETKHLNDEWTYRK